MHRMDRIFNPGVRVKILATLCLDRWGQSKNFVRNFTLTPGFDPKEAAVFYSHILFILCIHVNNPCR